MVASLKAELEAQRALGRQTRTLQKQLKDRDTAIEQLESQAEDLTDQLSSSQSQVKTLETKLAAARNTATNLENAAPKAPGSAMKKTAASRVNSAASAEVTQTAQLKEELYTDFTGLIIRDVKKREKDSLYDCIQTGVNGSKFNPVVLQKKKKVY